MARRQFTLVNFLEELDGAGLVITDWEEVSAELERQGLDFETRLEVIEDEGYEEIKRG